MARKSKNKEPSLVRTCPDGTVIVSREYIGWTVLYNREEGANDIDSILTRVKEKIQASDLTPPGKVAEVSYDGRAIVTFRDKFEGEE